MFSDQNLNLVEALALQPAEIPIDEAYVKIFFVFISFYQMA